jgi:hypothetical protein
MVGLPLKNFARTFTALLLTLAGLWPVGAPQSDDVERLQRAFEHPPDDSKIMMRWWWFGPAVTKRELEREMRLMKEGGIGGFEVQPVYPVSPDDPASGIRNLSFLSDEFIDALRFTSEKAQELGLRVDLTLGSGWPYGGPQIPVTQAAGRLRMERVKVPENFRRIPVPNLAGGETLIAAFLARFEGTTVIPDSIHQITDIRDGALWIPGDLRGSHDVLFFISSRTGMQVKRPAVGAEGFVVDHYDRGAIDSYLKIVGDRLMQAFSSRAPYAVFCDSLEVYQSDWTADFLPEFRKRRGYDLQPYLPALMIDIGPATASIRHDWGKTLTELLNERFLGPMREWSKRHRTLFRIQCYGIPPAALSSNAFADLPEGEGPQWKILRASRWASSASHLYGRPVTSSETWTWLHSPVFRATPLDLKVEADLHFLQGINQLIGHGWPYTAEGVTSPGWRFYAAGVFNEKNPWWIVMPDLSVYLQRVSFLMRQGEPVNDVALYLPDSDAWASFSNGRVNLIETLRVRIGSDVIGRILEAGFNLDFFDDDALAQLGRIENNALVMGANRYRAVIVPNVERIPAATLRKLDVFARGGGALIATRQAPSLTPGFRATETEQSEVRELSRRLFGDPSSVAHLVRDENRELGRKLATLLRPDVTFSPAVPEIGFIHRSIGSAQIYFLANTSNIPHRVTATFRVQGMNPEWWDPFTGTVSPAAGEPAADGRAGVVLDLEAYGSRVLVFTRRSLPEKSMHAAAPGSPLDLSSGWSVAFEGRNKPFVMERLRSWTDDEETRYFSGIATYEKEVTAPGSLMTAGFQIQLDFGEAQPIQPQGSNRPGMQAWLDAPVREAALVYINDKRAGSVWRPPYSLDVTPFLKAGKNKIRILVGNLAINQMAGQRLPDYRLLNLRYGLRFEPQDMDKVQPVPAGLFGPIRLIPKN